MTTNPHETEARARKARLLAAAFRVRATRAAQAIGEEAPDAHEVLELARLASTDTWAGIAELGGIRQPSPETIAAALGILEADERLEVQGPRLLERLRVVQ